MIRETLTGFAVDLGGTKTAAARFENGEIVQRLQFPTDGRAGLNVQIEHLAGMLGQLGHVRGAPLGVAVTGRISSDGLWSAVNADTLSTISGVNLGGALVQRFGAAHCCNDACAAAVAEAHFGAGRGYDAIAYLTVSTGVGGGLVLNGHPVQSANGLAGHVGFSSSPLGDTRCGSGRAGTVESVAGGRAIARQAECLGHPDIDARAVFALAQAGADWADALVDRAAAAIAILCADLTAILGLDVVVLGGSIGLAPGFLVRVIAHMQNEPVLFRVPVQAAQLGHDSALLGALALHHLKTRE